MHKPVFLRALILTAAFFLSGCGALFPVQVPTPRPPALIGTDIVETSAAHAYETAEAAPPATMTSRPTRTPRPSETPRPTWTASLTLSPTVTFVITIPPLPVASITPTGLIHYPWRPLDGYQAANGCDLLARTPKMGTEYPIGGKFTASYTFANYGPYTWNQHEVDYLFVNGTNLAENGVKVFDLPTTVYPHEKVTINIPMVAPLKAGGYSTVWRLHEGDRFYCEVTLNISVK